jgi:hypothetical protein
LDAIAGPLYVVALLLVPSGLTKLVRPEATREALRSASLPASRALVLVIALVELVTAGAVLATGHPVAAGATALLYLGFAAFLLRLRARAGEQANCSCLGATRTPVTSLHIGLDLVAAAVAGAAVLVGLPPITTVLAATPWAGVPAAALLVLTVVLVKVLFSELPPVLRSARELTTSQGAAR